MGRIDIEELDSTIAQVQEYLWMYGENLFNVSIINNLKDFRSYLEKQTEKDVELRKYYIDYSADYCRVSESTIVQEKRPRTPSLSLNTILNYINTTDSPEDIKTIKLMLYNLLT